jgi:hypothetical protein
MQRIIPVAMGVVLAFAMAPASSQQLQQPTPLGTQSVPKDNGIGPQLSEPQAAKPPEVPSNLDQRPESSSPIPSTGPAKQAATDTTSSQFAPAKPKRVLDARGKPIRDGIQVAPNRVYDPATKRYYPTTPPGQPG